MEPTNETRGAAENMVEILERLLAALAAGTDDVDWLRCLAVLSAEIEYSGVRGPTVDAVNLAEECREIEALLTNDPPVAAGTVFATRYPRARQESPWVESLHHRALAAARDVAQALAPNPHTPTLAA
jgi:hypothetical protein